MGRGKRKLISKGIYKDRAGHSIIVSVRGVPREFRKTEKGKRYDKSWTPAELRDERIRIAARERVLAERAVEATDTFSEDVKRFLDTISSKGHKVNTQGYMAHWELHFKERQRNEITDIDAQTAFAAIDQAASTRTHIRRALIQFYEALNGKSGYNPGRALKKPRKAEDQVRDLPWADIEKIFAVLPPSRSKARLMLIAYVGLPHKQIAALKPSDLRLEARELVAHPRRKGAGVSGQVQPLSDYAIAALKEFVKVDAFGSFQNRQIVETFRSGIKLAGVTLPADARPYDLRHSFLTELARGGADIHDIAKLGMHATLEQAARYIKGVAAERATTTIQSVPRFRATGKTPITQKRSKSVQKIEAGKRGRTPHKRR